MSIPTAIVTTDANHIFTTSLMVAEKFEKNHFHVLRGIGTIIKNCPDLRFSESNFRLVNYRDAKGENRPMYNLTCNGFAMLALGFTGAKAFLWKITFINAFNHMEAKLNLLLVSEHHAMLADLYAKHPKWRQVRTDTREGFPQKLIAQFNGMNVRNVQRMQQRIRAAGIDCRAPTVHINRRLS